MSRSRPPPLSPEVRALLDRESSIPPVAAPARARALARARAAVVAGRLTLPVEFLSAPRTRWGIALAVALVASAAVGATAYEMGTHRRAVVNEHPAVVVAHAASPALPAPPAPAPAVATVAVSTPAPTNRTPPHWTQTDPAPEELGLLRRARSAVARRDFAAALTSIDEHARRFKNGRLAEEREALRVRALSGLGHNEEAERAADAFEARFPRSVLLPAVSRMPASGQ